MRTWKAKESRLVRETNKTFCMHPIFYMSFWLKMHRVENSPIINSQVSDQDIGMLG